MQLFTSPAISALLQLGMGRYQKYEDWVGLQFKTVLILGFHILVHP